MEIIAVVLLAGLVAGYLVLAGCDIGLGMLMPWVARTRAERRRAVSAMAPYFLGSEVWLLGAVGVAMGLLPELKAAVITGMWPVFVALLAGWLFRDAGLWMRGRMRGRAGRAVCDAGIVGGSWTLALSWGLAVGGLLGGGAVLTPFALGCALTAAALFALRGAAFGAERLVPAAGTEGAGGRGPRPALAAESGTAGVPAAGEVTAPSTPTRHSTEAGGTGPAHAADPGGAADTADTALAADTAARATRPLARAALVAGVLAAGASLLPGGAAPDRPLAAAAAALMLLGLLAATSGLSGPQLSRHTSAAALASVPVVVAAAVNLPVAPVPDGSALLVGSALAPAVPFMVLGQVWLYRMVRRPAPAPGYFA
ncbi:cytochrome d ubiquinol oxidase subunit II [Streptomonospora wellingtoniae]|uniref:Cytochrome d ubiquinol oxidase subunit II n=1 Tax=Streptomonospora wellingtoniae TaxID=3075544 RepID=A0ABU2KQB9_9ACTN|nr:cytochrome d ubiquinol oxidase subunit II [Streptomonospora sp. DSM 45055]MDT0301470.1 cytochrome d ubiquinol oxidase subunit II [Streptomonospora sp. DSM 45055]